MKKTLLILLACFTTAFAAKSADITITVTNFSYTSDNVTVNVGDNVIFSGSLSFHPTVQVDQTTWTTNGTTPMPGGFSYTSGTSATLTITPGMSGTTIYYVCTNHVFSSGMKGRINVNVIASVSDNRIRDFNFTVFPNPVSDNSIINISTKKATRTTITVFDMNGRQVQQMLDMNVQAGEITLPFKAGTLQKGTYILMMRTAMGNLQKQIFVY
jgi:plastocyanin